MTEPTRALPTTQATAPLPADVGAAPTTPADPRSPRSASGAAGTPPPPTVSVTRLLAEAAGKSSICWVRVRDGSTHPVWFVWHDDQDPRGTGPALYVLSGHEEQFLPWLPPQVEVILRSKDSGGRLLTLTADTTQITPESPDWDRAVEVVRPARLNLVGTPEQVDARWRGGCTIHVLTPRGQPLEHPGAYAVDSGARPVESGPTTTLSWRPWHWRGRPRSRRGSQ